MQLTVRIQSSYPLVDERILATLFDVAAPDGTLLAQGIATPMNPATVDLPDGLERAYVIGHAPSGRTVQQAAEPGPVPEVTLDVAPSPREWLEWVAPFRSLTHLLPQAAGGRESAPPGAVWTTLWEFRDGEWSAQPIFPDATILEVNQALIELDVASYLPHLLQVGGDALAWRLISLPRVPRIRVAITPSARKAPGTDAAEVTIARAHTPVGLDLIMSYLSRGYLAEAERLGELWHSADFLETLEAYWDPVSAAAAAYLLLKSGRPHARRQWIDELAEQSFSLADMAIVAAALALQGEAAEEEAVRRFVRLAMSRGPPVFSLGIPILLETVAAIHRGADETPDIRELYRVLRSYDQARAARGAYFAFYGTSPARPSWLRYIGRPHAPEAVPEDEARFRVTDDAWLRLRNSARPLRPADLLMPTWAREGPDADARRAQYAFPVFGQATPPAPPVTVRGS